MKKLLGLSLLALSCLFGPATALAQTNAPSTNTASANPQGLIQAGSDILSWLKDNQPYFGTNGYQVEAFALYNESKWGGLLDIHLPLTSLSTNAQISAGMALGYLDHQWYTATLSVQLGTTWNVPVIGKVYTWLESGPGLNIHDKTPIAQSFAGVTKAWDIYAGHKLSISGGVGNISNRSGQTYIGGLGITL